MRLLHYLTAALLFVASCAGQASATVVETFRLGGWSGSAFTDDQSGLFTTCVASASYRSGITLYVQVDTQYSWALGFSSPDWNMEVGADIPLQYRIDRDEWQKGVAKATSKELARMQMPQGGYIITRFRRGQVLYVFDGTNNYEFRLTGTSRLMKRLADCVDKNAARYGAAPGMAEATQGEAASGLGQTKPEENEPATASPDEAQLAIEATQALFNLMGGAGISGLKLTPDGQREGDLNGLHAVAADKSRTLVTHIFAPGTYTSEGDLMSIIIGDSQKACEEGNFSSGTKRIAEGGKELYTSYANCEAGDFQLKERVAFIKRKAGGIFVYGVADTYVGEGGGNPISPPDLTDDAFYSAAAEAAD